VSGDLRSISSSGTGKNWKEAAREWNDNPIELSDDDDEIMTDMAPGEVEQARSSGSAKKRRFDSLGGGLIPVKRHQKAWKRRFDSLGGGIIPLRKRLRLPHHKSSVDREAAKKNYLENPSIGDRARRRFDNLGGGIIPHQKRQRPPHHKSIVDREAAKNYLENPSINDKGRRRFDTLGGGIIPPRKRQRPPHHK